jgi:hypothetical protein
MDLLADGLDHIMTDRKPNQTRYMPRSYSEHMNCVVMGEAFGETSTMTLRCELNPYLVCVYVLKNCLALLKFPVPRN